MTSIILINPKFLHNVGNVLRAAACFEAETVMWTGDRALGVGEYVRRLPREERLRVYKQVHWGRQDRAFDCLAPGVTPVAVELVPGAQLLPVFTHPKNAAYVFGPEDGTLDTAVLKQCHLFVRIPMLTCANLAAAVYITLYDRMVKSGIFYDLDHGDEAAHTTG